MELTELLKRKIIFVQGKGGVGKTTVARAIAETLEAQCKKTLLVVLEDPLLPGGKLMKVREHLTQLNCEASSAFEHYAQLKIGSGLLAKLFTQNKLMRYMVQAAPGIKELTIMGQIWHERQFFDHIVVDMPATGHGITLFAAIQNWRRLFSGSPLEKEARAMTETFSDPAIVAHAIVALPEEMPMIEALELESNLKKLHDKSETLFILNRLFPRNGVSPRDPSQEKRPFATHLLRHLELRTGMELKNEILWKGRPCLHIPYFTVSDDFPLDTQTAEHIRRAAGGTCA